MHLLLIHKIASTNEPSTAPCPSLLLVMATLESSLQYMPLLHNTTVIKCFKFHMVLYVMTKQTCVTNCKYQSTVVPQEEGHTMKSTASRKLCAEHQKLEIFRCDIPSVQTYMQTHHFITANADESILEALSLDLC